MTTDKLQEIRERTAAASKNLILQAQRGFNIERIVEGIMDGSLKVLTIHDISQKLKISIDTITTWIKNGDKNYRKPSMSSPVDLANALSGLAKAITPSEIDNETIFPAPDFYLGNHPRWLEDTVKSWLYAQIKQAK